MELRNYLRDEILEEADYGIITEEERERRLALFDGVATTGTSSAPRATLMTDVAPAPASDASVSEDDPAITVEHRHVTHGTSTVDCYVVRPKDVASAPGVLVIHENRGLVPHIRDVARRLAKEGYVTVAPDLLSSKGGADSFSDPAEQIAALGSLDRDEMVADLLAALNELAGLDGVQSDNLGVIGFCFGGGMAWRVAIGDPRIHAAVPFYGSNPPLEDVAKLNGPVLAIYGALDERINAGIPDIEAAMAANGKSYEKEVYDGAGHAFHNDTNPDRYHEGAAHAAWARATSFLAKHLKKS